MSDLAPFVAATLRDKVLSDLVAENQKLRSELTASQTLKITSNHQEIEYATGSIEEGYFYKNNSDLWVIPLQSLRELPIQDLRTFQVYYGGALQLASLNKPWVHLSVESKDFVEYDYKGREEILEGIREPGVELLTINIDTQSAGVIQSLRFFLRNCSPLSQVALRVLVEEATRNNADPIELLTHDAFLEENFPDSTVKFVEALLSVNCISNVIDSLPLKGSQERTRLFRKVYWALQIIFQDHYGRNDWHAIDEQFIATIVLQLRSQGITNIDLEEHRRLFPKVYPAVQTILWDHYGRNEYELMTEQFKVTIVLRLVSQRTTNMDSEEFRTQVIEMLQAEEAMTMRGNRLINQSP